MNIELTGQVGEEAAGSLVYKGDCKSVLGIAGSYLAWGGGMQRQRVSRLCATLPGRGCVGDMDGSLRCFWTRDEPASGLMPPAGFLGEAGKRKPNLGTCIISYWRTQGKGTLKLEDRFGQGDTRDRQS